MVKFPILNADGAQMAAGAEFNVRVFGSSITSADSGVAPSQRRHNGVMRDGKSVSRSVRGALMIDHPQLNGNADSPAVITQNTDPENASSIAKIGHVAICYDLFRRRWMVVSTNGLPIPTSASFNIWANSGSWNVEKGTSVAIGR